MENPCKKNCPNRNPYCHGKCEDYQAWKKQEDIKHEKLRQAKYEADSEYWSYTKKTKRRRRR